MAKFQTRAKSCPAQPDMPGGLKVPALVCAKFQDLLEFT
jgi:hypothetical protein